MAKVTYRAAHGVETVLVVDEGTSLMQAAVLAGIDGIVGECGGNMMCATCHVYVRSTSALLDAISESEDALLEGTARPRSEASRLSCQIEMRDDLDGIVVEMPEEQF